MRGWSQPMDNVFDGGDGNDELTGGPGADTVRGGAGNDALKGEGGTDENFADVIDGGAGIDTVDDWATPTPTTRPRPRHAGRRADDGIAGENDNVTAVESSLGTGVKFRGTDAPEQRRPDRGRRRRRVLALGGDDYLKGTDDSETIDGGAGDDDIIGGYGNDTITGGAGQDEILGDREGRCNEYHCDISPGSAADTIDAVDGEKDVIHCGPGTDTAKVDSLDRSGRLRERRQGHRSRRPGPAGPARQPTQPGTSAAQTVKVAGKSP